MKIRRNPLQIRYFIIISFLSSSILFLSFNQLSFAQKDDKKDDVDEDGKYNIKLEDHNDWKVNKEKIKSTISLENTKSLNKNVNDMEYSNFNHFRLLYIIPNVEKNGDETILLSDTIIPITLYPNMSSLEQDRVYQNMSSLEQDRVYQNMSSLEQDRVYQNMSSLEQDRVYQNMSSLEQDRVYQNMSSLRP